MASHEAAEFHRLSIQNGRDWVRLGAVTLRPNCLRRYLWSLPIIERARVWVKEHSLHAVPERRQRSRHRRGNS